METPKDLLSRTLGRVSLIGAGPGDPELITERGIRRLQQADLVLYDALAHPVLLEHCDAETELIYVGKRAGRQSERQHSINQRLYEAALSGKKVVRLKGGDPFLFGRGSEEAEFLAAQKIPFEVVPGVPSPLAATAYAGISLTHRDLASSVAYITATESPEKDRSEHDWTKLATATSTLVIFMGLRKLASLTKCLIDHGRDPRTPAAVISSASLPSQRTVVGTVRDIAEKAAAANLPMPALTVVGPVVELRSQLRWFDTQALFGKKVIVTRPPRQARPLATLLRERGAEAIPFPTIQIKPPKDMEPLRAAVGSLEHYAWVIFTSQNGVESFFDVLERQGLDARALGRTQIAAVGVKTAGALRKRGLRPDLVPEEFRGEALLEALQHHITAPRNTRILLPRAAKAREVIPDGLRAMGCEVDVVPAYVNEKATESSRGALQRAKALAEEADAITFTSSSTVENWCNLLGGEAVEYTNKLLVASIGPITTATARKLGLRVDVTAKMYTLEGLVEAMESYSVPANL